jgi:hypothetical protein
MDAYTMIQGLHGMLENQIRDERYNISKALFVCKLAKGSLINPHVIKMMDYIETLDKFGCEFKDDLATDMILQLLPTTYEPFHGMLKTTEDSINTPPPHYVMMVQKKKKKMKRWMPPNGKGKEKVSDELSSSKLKTKGSCDPSPDVGCFHCDKKGHWFRNCKKYLEEQKKKKGSETSTSGMNVIEINIAISSSNSWVFNTGSMIHTCKLLQGLSLNRRFAKGELNVHVDNGAKVASIAVDTYHLPLPSGLVLELNNCYCIPGLYKNIISSSFWRKLMIMRL